MKVHFFALALLISSCITKNDKKSADQSLAQEIQSAKVTLHILGTVQDGGSPHIGCQKECCKELFKNPDNTRKVVSLGVVDHENEKSYLFEATPDISEQLKLLKNLSKKTSETPDGIFLTHAHIGHYTGLMYLGREALGSNAVKVYAMPKMKTFLETNGPWNQLIDLGNISILPIQNEEITMLSNNLQIIPIKVPHRDEFSETVGFRIMGPNKSVLFIPDIDKWSKWKKDIEQEIQKVDLAFLDATFYSGTEINTRNIEEIPHPFVIESMEQFKNLPSEGKSKVHFIHFNHTNPLLDKKSKAHKSVVKAGFHVAHFKEKFDL
ncbi:MBL fold metallo-hydrolase [Flagellimonas nanhaiensis]|uniref:Pyrroloquinoline quinone biosynthesis protein PqqB n=1 Tax=Flagellimonas nanhaiensis TaxID=2292706 RepID=A0A371JW24_9FLAO|nr:MBL fold metallo-hydrolase [Allomuricauda nanhaiensis]RDY61986.1 pyrroloquinoline quinone biosynthesis protein PqqB [Allomuricauda nanhaiensis]